MVDGGAGSAEQPGAPATPRARARSAALWGVVGGFAFLALAQGYRLLGPGSLPVGYWGLALVAFAVAVASAGLAYVAEVRLRAKRRT
ncbi:hypothetical protein C463_09234 [Halorubrum californiense DSM 19288]|uniref:DUF7981 domain-containing protein n=1 Tax=Halorubrum californiense DSM 19288 TaxID=1227465 RepID=M0EAC6_9EURY|nr:MULTISPECIES: hypothetical protein [Halorubrum]ELZ43837.1 hypothetical protein C463_09234 [Halorubrum californiense DSM 19288]TKX69325.1 hypothetical protein EXE40_11000 [Halorubrum sp. GN11GM_10-3_MGM]